MGPEKRCPAPAAKRTANRVLRGEDISNSLPEMLCSATLRRAFVAASLVVVSAFPVSAVQATNGSAEGRAGILMMPCQAIRNRNPISVNAVTALNIIMRTENIEDPTYLAMRQKVSDLVAAQMSLDSVKLHKAWSRSSRDHQIAVLTALTQLDVRYVVGKESPYVHVDCSGLLWLAWRAAGVDMPRQAVSQLDRRMRVERDKAVAGDIVGEGTHVHIYLGVGRAMVHAPFNGKSVRLKMMSEAQYNRVVWANPSNIATYRL
jgi:cell wall-associated NlpC family hydrolase